MASGFEEMPKAVLFDVFGTCVDWRTTVTCKLERSCHSALKSRENSMSEQTRARASNLSTEDWGQFAQEWRESYIRFTWFLAKDQTTPWKSVDEHHLDSLRVLVEAWELKGLWNDEELRDLSLIWHFLEPWSDSSAGIKALNVKVQTCTLSNGNVSLLEDLAKHAKLPFTHIVSAEQFKSYKPDPKVYLGAVKNLGLDPTECALVAAHVHDLIAAKKCGLKTIYVERPLEEHASQEEFMLALRDGFVDLSVTESENGFLTVSERLGIGST